MSDFQNLPLANYPGRYDDEEVTNPPLPAYLPYPGDIESIVDYIVKMRNSIIAIENELGLNPAGNQTTVSQRLDLLEASQDPFRGVGQAVHRVQIADKYSVNSIFTNYLCVGQIGFNLYDESGLSDTSGKTSIEVYFKVHVYVEKDTILTLSLFDISTGPGTLMKTLTFNTFGASTGGHFTTSVQLTPVTQVPLGESTLELRALQTSAIISPELERKSIIWDASLIVKSSNMTDGYALTGRYVEPDSDDLIVWKFDEETASPFDTFINSGSLGTDGDLVTPFPLISHVPGYNGIFENAALLSGNDMPTRAICASPPIISVSMWLNPTIPIVPNTIIALSKLDVDLNPVFTMKFDANNAVAFEYLGTDNLTHSFTCPLFYFNSTASWIFVGFVYDGYNVYTSANGSYELAGPAVAGIKYDGPLSAGDGYWTMLTSNVLVDDVRISQAARSALWFKTTYKLAINQYP